MIKIDLFNFNLTQNRNSGYKMLFRLNIQTAENKTVTSILVDYPDLATLIEHVDFPGDDGYQLNEVLGILVPNVESVRILNVEVKEIQPTDTVIRWEFLQNRQA